MGLITVVREDMGNASWIARPSGFLGGPSERSLPQVVRVITDLRSRHATTDGLRYGLDGDTGAVRLLPAPRL